MKKNLQTVFSPRQHMLSEDFEIYYYSDSGEDSLCSRVKLHSHDYYEFYFFLEGNVSLRIGDDRYPLKSGDMILIPPGVFHRALIHNTDIPYRRFVFWISRDFLRQLSETSPDYGYAAELARSRGHFIFHFETVPFNALQSKIFELIEEIHSNRFGKDAKISLCVQELALHINRAVYERAHPASPEEGLHLCQNLVRYIETHLEEELTLAELAREFYVSKFHISHVFKENFGLSVHSFITKKRLMMCRDSLLSRQEISKTYRMFGFRDYSSFYRAFKKEYGMSPKEYRDTQSPF